MTQDQKRDLKKQVMELVEAHAKLAILEKQAKDLKAEIDRAETRCEYLERQVDLALMNDPTTKD